MSPHMVCLLPYLNSNAQVRHLRITVPLVAPLLDNLKYFLPDDLPPPSGDELRPLLGPGSRHRTATPRSSRLAAIRALAAPTLR